MPLLEKHDPEMELTFMEDYVWANLGYVFCQISFRAYDWQWYLLYPGWCHSLGGWFYGLAYDRYDARLKAKTNG